MDMYQMDYQSSNNLCNPEITLWMGDLNTDWDANFIKESFRHFSNDIQNVKMVTDRAGRPSSYCFIEFKDSESARNAMLSLNGRSIPNDTERSRFNLSFANSPNPSAEYNLFVSNLSSSVEDASLFRVFGERYASCRGAKVYRNPDGTSREFGFVRFTNETDQQMALLELNKHRLKGKEMLLKLAQPKERRMRGPPRGGGGAGGGIGGYSTGRTYNSIVPPISVVQQPQQQPYIIGNHGHAGFGNPQPQYVPSMLMPQTAQYTPYSPMISSDAGYLSSSSRDYDRKRRYHHTKHYSAPIEPIVNLGPPPPIYFEGEEPLTAEEHNELMISMSLDFLSSMEASRWNRVTIPNDLKTRELSSLLYSA